MSPCREYPRGTRKGAHHAVHADRGRGRGADEANVDALGAPDEEVVQDDVEWGGDDQRQDGREHQACKGRRSQESAFDFRPSERQPAYPAPGATSSHTRTRHSPVVRIRVPARSQPEVQALCREGRYRRRRTFKYKAAWAATRGSCLRSRRRYSAFQKMVIWGMTRSIRRKKVRRA